MAKPLRIIGDPDNQLPDKWSSTVQNMKTGSGAFPVFYFVRTLGSFPGDKVAGT
jgi:hypothetical protein